MTDFNADPDYEECLVTFFDVLGFRNLLHTRSGAEIREMLSTFRQVSEGDTEQDAGHTRLPCFAGGFPSSIDRGLFKNMQFFPSTVD